MSQFLQEIVPCSQTTSLFQRFQDDILAGRKTITIRDESESHFKTGDVLVSDVLKMTVIFARLKSPQPQP